MGSACEIVSNWKLKRYDSECTVTATVDCNNVSIWQVGMHVLYTSEYASTIYLPILFVVQAQVALMEGQVQLRGTSRAGNARQSDLWVRLETKFAVGINYSQHNDLKGVPGAKLHLL